MADRTVLAIDLGAESGRVMAVRYDGAGLAAQEVHRFANVPVSVGGTLHWDILRLWADIQTGIEKARPLKPASLGVDTWGVDFALLDRAGGLVGNPVHYRDHRTDGIMERVFARVPREEIFAATGNQLMAINTLFQLYALVESKSPLLDIAATFLTLPDLLNYWLTGEKVCEYTIATTTQMLDARSGEWARDLLDKVGIRTDILPPVVRPGTRLGEYEGIPVIAPACHDTQNAIAAIPASQAGAAYISSGTWSLVGVEHPEPVMTPAALAADVTNEGGVARNICLLTNVTGLWILQQCRAAWKDQGHEYSYAGLVDLATGAPALGSFIDVSDTRFVPHGDHPALIREYCKSTGQPVPETHGAIMRCVLESLALKYRKVFHMLAGLTGRQTEVINIVGGGSQNALLNQLTADANGVPVTAGPIEATVLGNALVQLIALGEFKDIDEGRAAVARIGELQHYDPRGGSEWDAAYERYGNL